MIGGCRLFELIWDCRRCFSALECKIINWKVTLICRNVSNQNVFLFYLISVMWSVSSSVSFFNQWHHYPAGSDITGRVSACGDVHTRPLRVTRRLMFNSVPRVYSQTEETGLLLNGELIHDVINSSLGARAPPRLQPLCYYFCWSVSRWDGETHVCGLCENTVIGLIGNVLELLCSDYITERMQINGLINELKSKSLVQYC